MGKSVHFILTGGTIDSFYYPPKETARPHEASVIPSYISEKIKPVADVSFETVCMLDSSDITLEIRQQIAQAILQTDKEKIVIIHGTNTMTKTAEYLVGIPEILSKTVILTGAMIPLKEFAMSDAGFNLGYALAEVQSREPGVYVCMNAQTFKAGAVVKNTEEGRFEAV